MVIYKTYGKEVGIMLLPNVFKKNYVDSLFDDFFSLPAGYKGADSRMMNTNIRELEKGYMLEVELAGYDKKDVKAELKDGYLTVSAFKEETKEEKEEGKYIRRERYSGNCERSFYLGEGYVEDDFKANFENGILKIEFPKKEIPEKADEKKYISIK